jgi:iron complex outermembrane receptor protein
MSQAPAPGSTENVAFRTPAHLDAGPHPESTSMFNRSVAASLAAIVFIPSAGFAADEDDTVVVTGQRILDARTEVGGRLGLSNRELAATVDVVTQEDFQVQGVRTALEAMNAAPGVNSGNLPGSVGAASMRGFHRAINWPSA